MGKKDKKEDKKIIVDEDWKEQARREKEILAAGLLEKPAGASVGFCLRELRVRVELDFSSVTRALFSSEPGLATAHEL